MLNFVSKDGAADSCLARGSIGLGYMRLVNPSTVNLDSYAISSILVVLFILTRVWHLTAASLDGDEIFSLVLARSNWHGLITGAVNDAMHPPLFYLLLKLWVGIGGESLLWLRLFPLIVSALCLIPFVLLCRSLNFRPATCNLALGIAVFHPGMVFYAQHLRMYGLLMLGGLMSIQCFEAYLNGPSLRLLIVLSFVNCAVVFTHYYGWLLIALEFMCLIWRRQRWIPMAMATLCIAGLFVPWAWIAGNVLYAQGLEQRIGWIPRPTLRDLGWFFVDLAGCADLPRFRVEAAAVILVAIATLLFVYRKRQTAGIHWLAVLSVAPVAFIFMISQWAPQSVWGHRHLVFVFWPFIIVLADCLCQMPKAALMLVMTMLGFWAGGAIISLRNDDRKLPYDRLVIGLLDRERSSDPTVQLYLTDSHLEYPLWFYIDCLRTSNLGPFGWHFSPRTNVNQLAMKSAQFEILRINDLGVARGAHFWIGYSESNHNDTLQADQILSRPDCHAGDAITARDRFHSVKLVPMQCQ